MSGGLGVFLRLRFAEEEKAALEAADGDSGEWFVGQKWNVYRVEDASDGDMEEWNHLVVYGTVEAQSEHVARYDPARIVADLDVKRRILQAHHRSGQTCPRCSLGAEDGQVVFEKDPCETLRLLALPYASHADYKPEWAPRA